MASASGEEKRIATKSRSGSARRDRAQTFSRAGRSSAWREGKAAGWPPPAD
jgi:hypothetical protein